jgi:hypothetical protein
MRTRKSGEKSDKDIGELIILGLVEGKKGHGEEEKNVELEPSHYTDVRAGAFFISLSNDKQWAMAWEIYE